MKTISIGDIHGREDWKEVDPEKYDKIIFVGDYVDSFTVPDDKMLNNLLDIIQFKKDYMDKVILLFGNHDLHYLFKYDQHGCSGYRPQMYEVLHKIFTENKDLFQMSYQYNDTIWTHAGIHDGWWKFHFKAYKEEEGNISDRLNLAFDKYYLPLFNVSHIRGGMNKEGGPFWCDRSELTNAPLKYYSQIVGHSRVKEITKIYKHNKEIVFIDVIENEAKVKFYEKDFTE